MLKANRLADARRLCFLLCGPDGIRTRDLGLDRAACLAATPRDHLLSERAVVYHTQ